MVTAFPVFALRYIVVVPDFFAMSISPDAEERKLPDSQVEAKVAEPVAPKRKKGVYVGAPACFALELACKHLNKAFGVDESGHAGIYLVGSALQRPDWRDIDVRLMMDDASFQTLFPNACLTNAAWEFDARWAVMCVAISKWLSDQTGLPVDFQFQPMTFANERHKGPRSALGLEYAKST